MNVDERWRGRPKLALALKTLIVAVPLALSVIVSLWAANRLPHPEGLLEVSLWWLALMVISLVVLMIAEAGARQFLPLVALLRLSLLFPGAAPSRISVARASTRAELRRLQRLVQEDGLGDDLATVARTLVILVGALDAHDRSTRGHSERVRVYTDMLAERLGLEEFDRDRLRWAALLHDLGKLRIPVEVLNKRGALSEADWELIHRHPEDGERMLGPLREWLGEWALVVRHHHERWDGDGYPDGIAGEEISLGARVVAVADSYDVMTSVRSYQQRPRSSGAAREELVACAGTQFDPTLVRRFLGLSTKRLWLLLGPLAWVAQLPIVGPVLSEAAASIGGQTVVALGAASATQGGLRELTRVNAPAPPPPVPTTTTPPSTTSPETTTTTTTTTTATTTTTTAPTTSNPLSELIPTSVTTTDPPLAPELTTSTTTTAVVSTTSRPTSTTSTSTTSTSEVVVVLGSEPPTTPP